VSAIALVSNDLRDVGYIQATFGGSASGSASCCAPTDQVKRWLNLVRELNRISVSVNMHIENAWLVPAEVIMNSGDLQPMIEQRGHHRIDLFLRQYEVAHQDVMTAIALGHCESSAKSKRSRQNESRYPIMQIVPGNVHLQYVRLVIPRLSDDFQHLLVLGRNLLGGCGLNHHRNSHHAD
jgi:hypothetical protein